LQLRNFLKSGDICNPKILAYFSIKRTISD